MGKSAKESMYIEGYALNCVLASQQMPHTITKPKIALLDFDLVKAKLPLGVTISTQDAKEIAVIHQREADILKEKVRMIIKAGANVILTTHGIDDLATAEMVEAGVMGVRR